MIRKVIIGPDYRSSMAYVVGQPITLDKSGEARIHDIVENESTDMVEIYVINSRNEIDLWKKVPKGFATVEYDIFS